MKHSIDISFALELSAPSDQQIERWAWNVLDDQTEDCSLAIHVVDQSEGRALNRDYRGKDYPTNVLAFRAELHPELELRHLGDIVICAPVVEIEAQQQNKQLLDHWAHLVTHGVLHLLGFDHQHPDEAQAMEDREAQLLARLGISNPY